MRQMALPVDHILLCQGSAAADKYDIFRVFVLRCTRKIERAGYYLHRRQSGIDYHDLVVCALMRAIQPDRYPSTHQSRQQAVLHLFSLLAISDDAHIHTAPVRFQQSMGDAGMRKRISLHQHLSARLAHGRSNLAGAIISRGKKYAHVRDHAIGMHIRAAVAKGLPAAGQRQGRAQR